MIQSTHQPGTQHSVSALVVHSSADQAADGGKLIKTDSQKFASAKEMETYTVVKSLTGAAAFGGVATSWKLPKPAVFAATVIGACIFPIVSNIKKWADVALFSSMPQKKKEMSKEQALALLNVPEDRVSDFEFIDAQYRKFIQQTTPKVDLGQSPLAAGVNELLEDIKQAYAIAKTN